MCIALETDHMIASMRFLRPCIARRADLCVQEHVIFGCFFFGRDLKLRTWEAGEVFTVPAGFADETESEGAIETDG